MHGLAFIVTFFFAASLSAAEARLRIVTSFFPLYCWTANIVGESATVENLLPPRSEPHEYAFTPSDARRLSGTDLIIVNGLGLEPWLPKFRQVSSSSKSSVLAVSAGLHAELIANENEHGHGDGTSHANPHIWLDPQFAAQAVSNISITLQRMDRALAATYADNARRYLDTLSKLDRDIQQSLAGVTNRAIVTYHDAFPYFARRYGLGIAGAVEQVPDVNPTPKYLSQLGRTMRERNIRVIFIPPNETARLARRIAADLHVELAELDTLETGPLSPSAYEERMRANAAVLRKYLK